MSKSLLIIGAGGHGRVVKEVAEALGYDKIAFLDDNSADAIGKIADSKSFVQEYQAAFVGIGNNKFRNELLQRLEQEGYETPALLHPTAYISKTAVIGKGTVVEPKAIVNANSRVGVGCIISVGAIVDHDVTIEDYCHINSGAICMAGSQIKKKFTKVDAGEVKLCN